MTKKQVKNILKKFHRCGPWFWQKEQERPEAEISLADATMTLRISWVYSKQMSDWKKNIYFNWSQIKPDKLETLLCTLQ